MAIRCPSCRGEGHLKGFGCGPNGCRLIEVPCPTCKGTKEISSGRAALIREGEKLRESRKSRHLTLREAAKQLGIHASELSDAEMGRTDPAGYRQKLETPE
jgi:hypothetical protein